MVQTGLSGPGRGCQSCQREFLGFCPNCPENRNPVAYNNSDGVHSGRQSAPGMASDGFPSGLMPTTSGSRMSKYRL
jgi:hypothetical protein